MTDETNQEAEKVNDNLPVFWRLILIGLVIVTHVFGLPNAFSTVDGQDDTTEEVEASGETEGDEPLDIPMKDETEGKQAAKSPCKHQLPNDVPVDQFLREHQPGTKGKYKKQKGAFDKIIAAQIKLGDRLLALERKTYSQDPNKVYLPYLDAYMGITHYRHTKKVYKARGYDLDTLCPVPVTRTKKGKEKQIKDIREGELCFVLPPVFDAFKDAEERIKGRWIKRGGRRNVRFRMGACGRGRNRQIGNKTIRVYDCIMPQLKGSNLDEKLKALEEVSDKKLWKCHESTANGKKPVGGILTSRHSLAEGMDIVNRKDAAVELTQAGFTCGVGKKGWLTDNALFGSAKSDPDHCYLKK